MTSSCESKIRQATTDDIPLIRSLADVAFRDTYRESSGKAIFPLATASS